MSKYVTYIIKDPQIASLDQRYLMDTIHEYDL